MIDKKQPLLQIKNLTVTFKVQDGTVKAVNGISFKVYNGEIVGIVGESGSGKSQSMLAIMGLLAQNGITHGSVVFNGKELIGLKDNALNKIRGNEIAMVFQDPMTSLNPYLKISAQMTEILILQKRRQAVIALLEKVKIPDAKNRIHLYPHEFSGGMRQRVMIAMMLLTSPKLLIADEPTTALDVTVQAQILELLKELRKELGMAIVFITHDMGVVANLCDRVNVMYGGGLMETATIDQIFNSPAHPYTQALLNSIPSIDEEVEKLLTIAGEPPNLLQLPDGCPFQNRCSSFTQNCINNVSLRRISSRQKKKKKKPIGEPI